jgi:hypothetical protein
MMDAQKQKKYRARQKKAKTAAKHAQRLPPPSKTLNS